MTPRPPHVPGAKAPAPLTGLRVIDMDKMERVTPSFQAELDKVRIRQIMNLKTFSSQ